jgi:DNA-binding SARP family transcriptional activator
MHTVEETAGREVLRVRLLGELDLRFGSRPLPALESGRAETLLAFLLLNRDAAQPRQRLAFLLWPDSTEAQARTNLRHVLHNLRRALPELDRYLEITPRTLRWQPGTPLRLDVAEFEQAVASGDDERAVAAYGGDLLEGNYDEWLLEHRDRLRELHLEALDRLATRLARRREYAQAIHYAERLVRHDPLREDTYRLLMQLHDGRGDRARALRAYHACAAALDRELGIVPSRATRELYEALLPGDAQAPEPTQFAGALVGRAAERERLIELWRDAERGRSRLVLITGEPGIGKTRLLEDLSSWCTQRGAVIAFARSYAAEGKLALGPVTEWLRSDALASRRGRLDAGTLAELARLLPELGPAAAEPLPEEERRRRLFGAVERAIRASGGPVLLVADDLHWADDETLQFLHYLLRGAADAQMLIGAAARHEDVDALAGLLTSLRMADRVSEIELDRLSREETGVLADRLADRRLETEEMDRLFAETDGNPLFVLEALRAGWTDGRVALPPRVHAVIEFRLAQLSGPANRLAGVAATVGREFTSDLLVEASELDERELVHALDELWRRRVIADRGPDAYDFTHDKLREVAYQALSPMRRRRTHLLVARALAAKPGSDPAQVAVHYDRAGAGEQAADWYRRAAAAEQLRGAGDNGVRHLERALALVSEGSQSELSLVAALLATLGNVEGYAAPRIRELQARALALARAAGVEPEPALLRSLALSALTNGDLDGALRYGEEMRRRAEHDDDVVLGVESAYVLGISAFWRGELQAARAHFELAIERYREEHRAIHALRYGLDPRIVCLSRLANTLAFLGDADAARRARDAALAFAEEVGHEPSRGTALVFATLLAVDLQEWDDVRAYTAMTQEWRRSNDLRALTVSAECFAGLVEVLDGHVQRGLVRIRSVVDALERGEHAPGNRASLAHVLVEACAIAGEHRAGLEASELVTSVRLWRAETLWRRSQFLAALGAADVDVDGARREALAIAKEQGMSSFRQRIGEGTVPERPAVHARPD